jgi:signal transduction histidine kinase
MFGLLSVLAALQYRWLGEVSDAEKERMQARMHASAARFARDFDRELTRALVLLTPGGPPRRERESYGERRQRWASAAMFPELVRGVFVAAPGDDRTLRLFGVDEQSGNLSPVAWPDDLARLRSRLESVAPARDAAATPRRSRALAVPSADIPALAAPYFAAGPATSPDTGGAPRPPVDSGYAIVWLSEDVIEQKLLPELAARNFSGAEGLEDRLEVLSVAGPPRGIYRAGPSAGDAAQARWDVEVELPGVLRTDELDAPPESRGSGPPGGPPRPAPPPQWRLRVADPSGSLDGAVSLARHRNLAVAFGTLLLLAVAMATLLVSTRRAHRLARQRLEFTAGVTHELVTPLAGMRSAAQNLADGVIHDPAHVRAYGALIEREGRRLTEMVDQVLTFAGMQSGRAPLTRHPLAIGDVIEAALATSQRSLDENGFRVVKDIPADLPPVSGDGPALRRALENLIGNAVKYATDGAWLGLRAGVVSDRRGRWLEVSVEDRGPGIAPRDLPHVFEAFYRGGGRSSGALPGSGLGLTLVKNVVRAHGGRVTVETLADQGTSFKLTLPVMESAGP